MRILVGSMYRILQTKEILYWRNKYCVRLCNSTNVLHTPLPIYEAQIIYPS